MRDDGLELGIASQEVQVGVVENALVREALATIRLYRPLSTYVGSPEREISEETVW